MYNYRKIHHLAISKFNLSYYVPAPRIGSIKRWCASDVWLSVAYIGPKSKIERPIERLKLGRTEVADVTPDSDTTFKVKGQLAGAEAYCGASRADCFIQIAINLIILLQIYCFCHVRSESIITPKYLEHFSCFKLMSQTFYLTLFFYQYLKHQIPCSKSLICAYWQ